jgi:phosphoribosyl 1,2-cyclic phosphodiesterase
MKIHFWGSRGSLPASANTLDLREKVIFALRSARDIKFKNDDEIRLYAERELPLPISGYYGSSTSCVEIGQGNEYVICDAGTGIADFARSLTKPGIDSGRPRIFNIFLSHLHWDHIQGFPYFVSRCRQGDVIVVRGGHEGLRRAFEYQQKYSNISIDRSICIRFKKIEPGKSYNIAGFEVVPILQNHPGDSYGYRFEHDGKNIVYSTDCEHCGDVNAPDYRFIDCFRNADLLIIDAQYDLGNAGYLKENWGHSSNIDAVELGVRAGVRHICLFHNEPTVNDTDLQIFLENTRLYLTRYAEDSPMQVSLAYDGLEINV